jgi:hypothetical protein
VGERLGDLTGEPFVRLPKEVDQALLVPAEAGVLRDVRVHRTCILGMAGELCRVGTHRGRVDLKPHEHLLFSGCRG